MNRNSKVGLALAVITAFLLCSGLTGCGKTDSTTGTAETEEMTAAQQVVSASEAPAETEPVAAENTVFSLDTASYDDILQRCAEILATEDMDNLLIGDDEPFTALMEVRGGSTPEEAVKSVGYTFCDLNWDGTDELIIGSMTDDEYGSFSVNQIYDIFTMDGLTARLLFQGWSRNRCYAAADGGFLNEGSSGASYSMFGVFRVEGNPAEPVWESFCFTEPDDNNQIHIYSNNEGVWDKECSEELEGWTADAFWAEESRLEAELVHTDLHSLESYRLPVTACRPEHYGKGADTCTWVTPDESDDLTRVVFRARENVTDFSIYRLSFTDVDENGQPVYDSGLLYEQDELPVNAPLGVALSFPGDMSSYGIAFTDAHGAEQQCILSESGMDGALILSAGGFINGN